MNEGEHPVVEPMPDYTADLRDRQYLRGYNLMNMVCGLPFDDPMGKVPEPHKKLWQETKNLISERKVPCRSKTQMMFSVPG
jgi:hypothetical protein